ncbi:hypothetical protein [Streptomyces humi]|uniref:hypothetical protein n=1 Tax=Streptomyces humi TaxID=1428620 RepID=UPI000628935B|nr:hypothetical protein [Streptomyces humi]
MGSIRLTLCAGLLVTAAGLAPTAAYAADGRGVTVTPASPAPGSVVTLRVAGCSGTTGSAVSTAFVSDARLSGSDGTLTGETQVRSTTGPGSYDVRVGCAGSEVTGRVTVVARSASRQDAPDALFSSPIAPVHAGGGGAAPLASVESRSAGPDTAQAVTGLLLAGFAAAAVGLLSARRSRGSR